MVRNSLRCGAYVSFLSMVCLAQSWENLSTLRPGDRIQVVDQKFHSVDARFIRVFSEGITFERAAGRGGKEVTVARAEVLRVSLNANTGRHRKTMIGLTVGAGAGAALLGGISAARCCNSDYTATFIIGTNATIGAGIGAALGALAGHGRWSNETLYRSERKRR